MLSTNVQLFSQARGRLLSRYIFPMEDLPSNGFWPKLLLLSQELSLVRRGFLGCSPTAGLDTQQN